MELAGPRSWILQDGHGGRYQREVGKGESGVDTGLEEEIQGSREDEKEERRR